MSSTTEYDDRIEVISTRGSLQLNDDSGYAGSSYSQPIPPPHPPQHRTDIMERYCELGAENQVCMVGHGPRTLDPSRYAAITDTTTTTATAPPRRFILQTDEEIIRNCYSKYANGQKSSTKEKGGGVVVKPYGHTTGSTHASGTETCLIPPASSSRKRKKEKEMQTPSEKRVARMIVVVAGVLLLASFVLVGVTLSMSAHIDEMVKKMHSTTPYPVRIYRTTMVPVNGTRT